MYCKNCGKEMNDNQAICLACGVKTGDGKSYCANCGQPVAPEAAVCTSCGVAIKKAAAFAGEQKSKLVAGLLGIFLGSLGVHNFYLGYTKKAVIQLVLCLVGSCIVIGPMAASIWGLVEGIMILAGKITEDGKGVPLKD